MTTPSNIQQQSERGNTVQKTIMVVDDQPFILTLFKKLLPRLGYQVVSASTGAEALNTVVLHSPDLIILDIHLPDMTGHEVYQVIRTHSAVPIMLMTGGEIALEAEEFKLLPADTFLAKPFDIADLTVKIRSCVSHTSANNRRIELFA